MTTVLGDQPPSFHYENSDDWGRWVLSHGLPDLPPELGADDEVPIASWAGERLGVVLFRSWSDREDGDGAEPREIDDDHYCWVRTQDGWESVGSGGGSGGPIDDPMSALEVARDVAQFGGEFLDGNATLSVRGLTGVVGADAKVIELLDRQGVTRRPVYAPLGQVVVCWDAEDDATVRIRDARGRILAETRRQANLW